MISSYEIKITKSTVISEFVFVECYTFQAVAFQTLEILKAMELDSKLALKALLVDGGMTKNELLMQTQSDFLGRYIYYLYEKTIDYFICIYDYT